MRKTDLIDLLNDAGRDGWELVTFTPNAMAYMNRFWIVPRKPGRLSLIVCAKFHGTGSVCDGPYWNIDGCGRLLPERS